MSANYCLGKTLEAEVEGEKSVGIVRNLLLGRKGFDLFLAFCALDVEQKGYLTSHDYLNFLNRHGIAATLKDAEALLHRYDRNGDGKVTYYEFVREMVPLGQTIPRAPDPTRRRLSLYAENMLAYEMKREAEVERDISAWKKVLSTSFPKEELYGLFRQLDQDHTGYISTENMHAALRKYLPGEATTQDLTALMERFDRNGDGRISYLEFVEELYIAEDGISAIPVSSVPAPAPAPAVAPVAVDPAWEKARDLSAHMEYYRTALETQLMEIKMADMRVGSQPQPNVTAAPIPPPTKAPLLAAPHKELLPKMPAPPTFMPTTSSAPPPPAAAAPGASLNSQVVAQTIKSQLDSSMQLERIRQNLALYPTFDLSSAFSTLDANNDGFVTTSELADFLRKHGLLPHDATDLMSLFDKNHDGKISYLEFLEKLIPKDDRCKQLLRFRNGRQGQPDGKLEKGAEQVFAQALAKEINIVHDVQRSKEKMTFEDIHGALKALDADHDGYVDAFELKDFMMNSGLPVTFKDVNDLLLRADINHDGKVNYGEFIRYLLEPTNAV